MHLSPNAVSDYRLTPPFSAMDIAGLAAGLVTVVLGFSLFPYPVKAWLNGHESAKRETLAAGLGFT